MVTTVKIYTKADYNKVISWLQEHIGVLLHSQPIIFWHGEGWHMKLEQAILNDAIIVDFDNPEHATWFGLVWQ